MRVLLILAALFMALPAHARSWSSNNPIEGRTATFEWRDVAEDPTTALDMQRCTKQIWQYSDDTTSVGDTNAGATLYHCTDASLAVGDCTSVITFTNTTTGQELNLRPAIYKLDVTAGTSTSASRARVQALCSGGDGPWTYSSGPPTTWTASGATRYVFQGSVGWTGDGNGARLESDINTFASNPIITSGTGALFLQDNNLGLPMLFAGHDRACTDASDGSGNSRTCPETATSGGTQSGGVADGYCDDFGSYGDCTLQVDRTRVSTQRDRIQHEKITFGTSSLVGGTSGYFGAKCASRAGNFGDMEWCNGATTRWIAPPDAQLSVQEVGLTWSASSLPYTNPPDNADCTVLLGSHADRNAAVCNRPGIDACAGWSFEPIVHIGDGATASGTPQLLDTLGENVRVTDFDGDGNSEEDDLVTTGVFQLFVHHRHECSGTTTSPGEPCFTAADCTGGAPTCIIDTATPYVCLEVPYIDAEVVYTIQSRSVAP